MLKRKKKKWEGEPRARALVDSERQGKKKKKGKKKVSTDLTKKRGTVERRGSKLNQKGGGSGRWKDPPQGNL